MKMKPVKLIALSAISLIWLAGIVCMFFNVGLGIALWAVGFLAGFIVFLYQRNRESLDEVEKAEAEAEKAVAEDKNASGENI